MTYHRLTLPILGPLLVQRTAARMIVAAALYQGTAVAYGLPSCPCPILHLFGVPCPTCGMSRALVALAHGDLARALLLHAFAPLVALGLALIVCASVLPTGACARMSAGVIRFERRTGLVPLVVLALLIYWVARMLVAPALFLNLIAG